MSKQTAVEWLVTEVKKFNTIITREYMLMLFDQAKQIEEEQIKNNYLKGCAKVFDVISNSRNGNPLDLIDADKYYNETYGGKK
jgi:hypothetical protein